MRHGRNHHPHPHARRHARQPRAALQGHLEGHAQANLARVQGGRPDAARGGAHLLRGPLPLPRPARPAVPARAGGGRHDRHAAQEHRQPHAARDVVTNAVHDLQGSNNKAGFAFVAGLVGALWSASGYVGGFMKASNVIYEVEEGRKFWKLKPLQIAATVLIMLLTAIIAISVVVTGPVAEKVGNIVGAGDAAVTVFNIAKWPVIALIVSLMFAFLYYIGPNVKQPGFKWVSPGGVVAVILWVIASAAFAFYVANFGSYSKTYGSMAAVIIFLIWLWITNLVMLLGAELNAEIERGRQIEGGHDANAEPFLPHREPPKES